jgi:hypothetical protein
MRLNQSAILNCLLILLVIYFSFHLIFDSKPWIFLDFLNLFIHEAGHLLFTAFGQFISILGGSLFQILFPFSFFIYFLIKKDYFASSFIIFWIADNIINVSVYMRDAIPMALPLLGGDGTIHDWNYLFVSLGLLSKSQLIGTSFYIIGVVLILVSIIGMILFALIKTPKIYAIQ